MFLSTKGTTQCAVVLFASYCFYAIAGPAHLAILLAVTCITFGCGLSLGKTPRRWILTAGLGLTFIFLFTFKYLSSTLSFVSDIGWLQGSDFGPMSLVLPVGISFYTFQASSYLFDVYRGSVRATRNFVAYATYLAFFPQILAGPIERVNKLLPQVAVFSTPTTKQVYLGLKMALWGYFSKLVIADGLAGIIDSVWFEIESASKLMFGAMLVLFSFRIYFDFLGYTSIARGVALIFGIELSRNFDRPFLARSIKDFWRRWHMTLTGWFRDYIYIAMGGNRGKSGSYIFTVILIFALSGLWHGAAIGFVIWGLIHAMYYLVYVGTKKVRQKIFTSLGDAGLESVGTCLSVIFTFILVSVAWLPFIVSDLTGLSEAIEVFFSSPAGWDSLTYDLSQISFGTSVTLFSLSVFFFLDSCGLINQMTNLVPVKNKEILVELTLVNVMLIMLVLVGDLGPREFIYFRF